MHAAGAACISGILYAHGRGHVHIPGLPSPRVPSPRVPSPRVPSPRALVGWGGCGAIATGAGRVPPASAPHQRPPSAGRVPSGRVSPGEKDPILGKIRLAALAGQNCLFWGGAKRRLFSFFGGARSAPLAFLEGRSRFARLGLMIHVTSAFVQPGVRNRQVLEMSNVSSEPLLIHAGVRICQLVLMRTEGEARYSGRFSDQQEI